MSRSQVTRNDEPTGFEVGAIRRYPNEAKKLPSPLETWTRSEIGIDEGALVTFSLAGVVEKAGRASTTHEIHYWRTADGVREWVEEYHANRETTPCGYATGIVNLGDDEYTCSYEDCDCRMTRAEAREVIR